MLWLWCSNQLWWDKMNVCRLKGELIQGYMTWKMLMMLLSETLQPSNVNLNNLEKLILLWTSWIMTCNWSGTQWKTWIEHIIPSQKTCVQASLTLNNKSNMKHLVSRNSTSDNKLMNETCNFTNSPKRKFSTCMMKNLTIKLSWLINVYKSAETKWLSWMMCRKWPTRAYKRSIRELTTSNRQMPYWIRASRIPKRRSWTHVSIIPSSTNSLESWTSYRRGYTLMRRRTRCLVNIW